MAISSHSGWDTSESGPARRVYSLTRAGDLFLSGWIEVLQNYQSILQTALTGLAPAVQDPETEAEA